MTSIQDAVEALSESIRQQLGRISDEIIRAEADLVQAWPSASTTARRRLMRELQARVTELSAAAGEIARLHLTPVLASAYQLGGRGVAATARKLAAFGGTDTAAIGAQAADTYADILAATQHVRESTKDLVRVLARDHIATRITTGQTSAQASRELALNLAQHNITAITYSDGARHDLRDYSDMLIRTKTAEAHQLGGFQQARNIGIEYMEIMDGPGCGWSSHQDSRKANGLIVTVEEAAKYPLSHPRCRRVASARPDLSSPEEARSATPLGPQFSAEDIARGHADSSVSSKAVVRAQATVARRRANGTIATDSTPKAARAHQTRLARRAAERADKR